MMSSRTDFTRRKQDVGNSEAGSDDLPPSPDRLKTIYSGISVSFITQLAPPRRIRGWKPVSMRPPVLACFILSTFGLVCVIEYFAQRSQKEGGLSLTDNTDTTTTSIILSRYAPTVVAVIYSLTWTWIDLDIRRMQPWLELSRGDGATADSSVLLDYPFEFLAFIPIKAGKRKHWLVFLAGTTMMLVFWAVTPLQSAIFGTQSVSISKEVLATDTAALASLDQQLYALDASVLNNAYAMTWLKQSFPDFTTPSHAYIPFQPIDQERTALPDEMWTAETTALSTDLECWPARVNETGTPHTYTFDNGRGCTQELAPSTRKVSENGANIIYTVLYIGYHEEAHLDWFLENENCGEAASHQFLAIWTSTRNADITALFCEPSYKKQKVLISVTATSRRPDTSTMQPREDASVLTESEFNSTAFEYLMGTGVPPKQIRRDYAHDKIIEQYAAMRDRCLSWPITNMVGFGLGGTNHSLADLQNATALQDVFTAAHKTIFSAAISAILDPARASRTTKSAVLQYTLYGVVVSRPIALAVEALLGVVAMLASIILFFSTRAHSSLSKDPGTIGNSLAIFRESTTLLRKFAPLDKCDRETLEIAVGRDRFKLVETDDHGPGLYLDVLEIGRNHVEDTTGPKVHEPTHHLALRPFSGIGFVAVVLTGMAVLLYLKRQEELLGGLPRPTNNFEVLQLIENYVPTIFATLVEPFLVLVNHLRCLLQPFHELRKGHKSPAKTLEASYTSIPPQLAIWRALSAGHILLASLSAISLLANVLAVALGALFNEAPVLVNYPVILQQTQLPTLNRTDIIPTDNPSEYLDFFYVTMANLSYGTSLPPWIDAEFAYLPFVEASNNSENSTLTYKAQTRGFGVDTVCSTLQTSPLSYPYVDYSLFDNGTQSLAVLYKQENGSITNCTNFARFFINPALNLSISTTSDVLAQELATQLLPQRAYRNTTTGTTSYLPDDGGFCERRLLMSWFRMDTDDRNGSLRGTHLDCVSTLKTAMFNLTVDSSGYVLDSQRLADFENVTTISQNETNYLLVSANDLIGKGAAIRTDSTFLGDNDAGWHNDTLTRDWMNYLLKYMLNSTSLVDPRHDPPAGAKTITAVQDLYKRLFSAALGLNVNGIFKASSEPIQMSGLVVVQETRIFMDKTAFIITIVIMGLTILVTTTLYIQEGKPYLPRLPSTIGSLAGYVAASHAVREYREPEAQHAMCSARQPGQEEHLYGFGKYLGIDGKEHVGVEMDPFVSPADNGVGVRFRGFSSRCRRRESAADSDQSK